jgi:hypothetical protein
MPHILSLAEEKFNINRRSGIMDNTLPGKCKSNKYVGRNGKTVTTLLLKGRRVADIGASI